MRSCGSPTAKDSGNKSSRPSVNGSTIRGLAAYNEMNDLLMEIIGLKTRCHPQPLDVRERHLFHLACYDLDTFRKQVFENNLLKDMPPPPEVLNAAETDDTVLLRVSLAWLKTTLFGAAADPAS